jgi:TctA family transporter
MLLVLNLPLVGVWVRLLKVPYPLLVTAIMVFSGLGIYSIDRSMALLITITVSGLVGYFLVKMDCEPAPLLLGFILGPMLEENLRRAMLLSRGSLTIFVTHPISAGLLAVAVLALAAVSLPHLRARRDEVFSESET